MLFHSSKRGVVSVPVCFSEGGVTSVLFHFSEVGVACDV